MSKVKATDDSPITTPKVSVKLNSTAYSLVTLGEPGKEYYQVVKFNFDSESQTMGTVEVVNEGHSQYDMADELSLLIEGEIYL
jgi:hypothetical protein